MSVQRLKNIKSLVNDIAEGYVSVNPIFLKSFEEAHVRTLYQAIERRQREVLSEVIQRNEPSSLRKRNHRLQRLHNAIVVTRNFARDKSYSLRG